MANDYDFQIDDLKFRAAITDEFPYQRATAPFRKEQFDSAPTVGDQSLTGWWTRGQLSFHKGAGLKFYEVLEGETVLNRYLDSNAVDVWTSGQAALIPNLADLAVAASSATPGTLSGVAGLFYTAPSGLKFYDGSGTSAITTSNGGVPTDVTSDGRYYLAANGERIERQSTTGALRTNYVTNPNFEANVAGWSDYLASGCTLTRDTTEFYSGTASLKATNGAGTVNVGYAVTGLAIGATYKVTMRVKSTAPILVSIDSQSASTSTTGWELVEVTFTSTATSRTLTAWTQSLTAGTFYVDNVMVTEFPCDVDYFDGSTVGGQWTGTANASTSTYAGASALRTNHVTNPSFEVDATGWTLTGAARDTAKAKYGSASLKVTATGGRGGTFNLTGLTVGTVYKVGGWCWNPASAPSPATIGSAGSTTHDAWEYLSYTFTATATTSSITLTGWDIGVYFDAIIVTEFPFEGDYFDGSTAGASWSGTANASKSTYASNSPAASYALWEHGDAGYEFERVWWAKGRIWAVDNTGRWYTLNPAGGTVRATDAIWTSGKSTASWSLADTPGAVFMADSGTIYSLTVDVDGAAVQLTAPVVSGILPAGEAIADMFYYLGHIIIATNKGVRVAQVQDTQLVYGPLVIEGDFSAANGIGAAGNLVYLVGEPTDHNASTLCTIDLTQEIDALRPPWAPWASLNDTTATNAGALVDPNGRLFAWAGDLYGSGTTLAASGTLTTGFHRFGTLDPKAFQTISVRCGGDGGSITVSRVDADGTITTLGSIKPSEGAKDFTIGLTDAVERIGLKFTLTRDTADSTKGPELLGYQLKALPVPERQRLLKWPLSLVDKVELRRGQRVGKTGAAYTNVKALEALESAAAIVTFTDHRTGETGSAYVDSVEFLSNTPSTHTTNGFGGIGYVTLRVLS